MPAVLPVIMPLPERDFDPTEAAVTWKILHDAGYQVEFATPHGTAACADTMMLSGEGLDPWGWIPVLKNVRLIGLVLRANSLGRAAYDAMLLSPNFQNPVAYQDLLPKNYSAMILPGGHAGGIRPYLEDTVLQSFVAIFFDSKDERGNSKPVAAICHGVVLAARSISKATGKSVLYGKKTTALTWRQERAAWSLTRFFARYWDPNYYRTYSEKMGEETGYRSVEMEVTRALARPEDFVDVPKSSPNYFRKTANMARDSIDDDTPAWVVRDGNYLSARWPGDAHTLARCLVDLLGKNEAPKV
jgi:putative intracellular protease/amidase